jgi:endoglucanase
MAGMKDPGSGLYGSGPSDLRYYDQNLALFSTGWSEERYRFESDGRLRVKWK